MRVIWPPWWKMVNRHFLSLVDNKDRFLLLYGGRDSSKSNFAAKLLIHRCMTEPYFRMLMIRKHYAWVKNSQYQNLYDIIHELGLQQFFEFKTSPVEIVCTMNGNKFIGAGADDVRRIKSIKDPTGCWYEEDIVYIPEDDWVTITTSIRSSQARFLQDVYTFNPEVEGENFEQNWFYKRFFKGHEDKKCFTHEDILEIDGVPFKRRYTVHHSTYKHNRWVTPERIAEYKLLKQKSEYYGKIYVDGMWGNKDAEGLFYYGFQRNKHIISCAYDPNRPIHLTFDFNVRPYVSASIWQVYEPNETHEIIEKAQKATGMNKRPTVLVKVGEIASRPPQNRTKYAAEEFAHRFANHNDYVYLYGDPAGKSEDTRAEDGADDFTIIQKELTWFKPKRRILESAPSVKARGEFINNIFLGLTDYAIVIDPQCEESINDYTNGKEDQQGRKLKERAKGDDGIPYEKFHHFTDGDDYFITKFLKDSFKSYLRGGKRRTYSSVDSSNFSAR